MFKEQQENYSTENYFQQHPERPLAVRSSGTVYFCVELQNFNFLTDEICPHFLLFELTLSKLWNKKDLLYRSQNSSARISIDRLFLVMFMKFGI